MRLVGLEVGVTTSLEFAWHPAETCAAQEAQESSFQIPMPRSYSFRDLSVHTDRRTRLDRLG